MLLSKNTNIEPLHGHTKKKVRGQICERCGEEMDDIQVCHQRCPNCGNEITCSD